MTSPADILRQEMPDLERISDAPKVFKVTFLKIDAFPIDLVRREVAKRYAKYGIHLTQPEMESITVQGGVISSKYFGDFEEALGLRRDNKMDARLEAALKNPKVVDALKKHFDRYAASEKPEAMQLAQVEEPIVPEVPRMPNPPLTSRTL